ncbi:MAG: right-handed parallel beta-helix repeat-containing protein [Planctomycetes bacterium]|nr:right-handed parallel beta-helix repeat-containing protein [Planctomycetota bacterium]
MRTLLWTLVLLAVPLMASATTYTVPGDGALQDVIDMAVSSGDTILVEPGTYYGNFVIEDKELSLQSTGGYAVTWLDGTQSGSVLRLINAGETEIIGFTITNGTGTQKTLPNYRICGGGIQVEGLSSPLISWNYIYYNRAAGGGSAGTGLGGGICIYNATSAKIENNLIMNNTADGGSGHSTYGGGIKIQQTGETVLVINNIIAGNTADGRYESGGGVEISTSTVIMINNTLAGNSAQRSGGGGLAASDTDLTVVNSIFWNNDGGGNGNQIQLYDVPTLTTISCSDIQGGYGGGLEEADVYREDATHILNWGPGMIDADPLFVDPDGLDDDPLTWEDNDFHLSIGSPCVDSGDNNAPDLPSFDFEGDNRVIDGDGDFVAVVDMGADELLATPTTIQSLIDAAENGDVVIVSPGTYQECITFRGKAITVRSDLDGDPETWDIDPENTVIDGMQLCSVVTFDSGEGRDSVLAGFTITNGIGNLLLPGHHLGGGVCCVDTSPTIRNNLITNNHVSDYDGGGVYCHGGGALVMNNAINGNTAGNGGGVVLTDDCMAELVGNMIYGNSAHWGGGINCWSCTGELFPKVINCTICDNTATYEEGGGLFCHGSLYSCSMEVSNTILWNNHAASGPEIYITDDGNPAEVRIDHSMVKGGEAQVYVKPGCTLVWGANMLTIETNPLFNDAGNDDYHLTQESCCINRGDNGVVSVDLIEDPDGDSRIHMGAVDIGADEFADLLLLESTSFTIQADTGGQVNFYLDAGLENSERKYYLLATKTGTNPGYKFPSQKVLPINVDWLTFFLLDMIMATPYIFPGYGFIGRLDSLGQATAEMYFFPCELSAEVRLDFAYVLFEPTIDVVSNPVPVTVVPTTPIP